jgi:hypothetical protein
MLSTVKGWYKVQLTYTSNLQSAKKWVAELTKQRMELATTHLEKQIKKKISRYNGNGRFYIIGGKLHQASAPYEPPTRVTDELYNSVSHEVTVIGDQVKGVIKVSSPKATMLELGTEIMAPRPFFKPTYTEERAEIMRILGGGK